MIHPLDLEVPLEKYFGFTTFRPGQKEVISNVLDEKDSLAILPTGSGKSLCYQLPSLMKPGITIVVSPLISLMIDQVKQMKAQGMKRVAALHSFLTTEERRFIFHNLRSLDLLYISPEMLLMPKMREALQNVKVSLFVVDEAHCISQWGHEFRTDYLKLGRILEELADPPLLAVSATATPQVQEDILFQLGRTKAQKLIYPMDKPNIQLSMSIRRNESEKLEFLKEYLSRQQAPAMIYFSSRQTAEKVCYELKEHNLGRIGFYHGGMEPVDRQLVQQQFMRNELDVICCTSAFGMGIDKPDIRLVIHYHLPPRIESFIQEIGRAGRDGRECTSLLLYSPGDDRLPRMFIESELPSDHQVEDFVYLASAYKKIPAIEECATLELSESQYNFLKYQMESSKEAGVIDPQTLLTNMKRTKNRREEKKQTHLQRMLEVLHTEGCRRNELYRHFQSHVQPPEYICCDKCDPSVFEVTYQEKQNRTTTMSWHERLQALLLPGGFHDG
ncbi:RecQ family ATP-dependent DNA helicase [Salimicrobium halophilum]|uniref:ATP-dependent DNA helicase RecQ n=1 Tax=Salimicrobium halophilum TaxID=86666 RepID=A0A1G8PYL9_9BACI|nr:ATP-dependent DNA helicase RecQ [Salimicrobium halophilum]SDI97604.1 ATP-dependent DNA helicase RecQ [Salimicrobium halophilum]